MLRNVRYEDLGAPWVIEKRYSVPYNVQTASQCGMLHWEAIRRPTPSNSWFELKAGNALHSGNSIDRAMRSTTLMCG